ncbi:hypothetical protein ACNUDN_24435 [Mycobacterium sp. smrl_JER01]|uniref:hypothetical protein n=1 Tax=Mycobacterium sp. smrl_JER01 TaxID=3402633 RepID=UPI003AD1CF81
MNPFNRRSSVVTALATCGAAMAVVVSGCSAGQVSQTATQEAAINGTAGNVGDIALRNIHLRASQTTDYVQPGTEVDLIFVAVNNSADRPDRIVSITSDIGEVTMTGASDIPVNGSLMFGTPDGQIQALQEVEPVDAAEATVALSEPITNGLTYDFTFAFQNGGETTVAVPVSAGEEPRRDWPLGDGSGGHSSGGGH